MTTDVFAGMFSCSAALLDALLVIESLLYFKGGLESFTGGFQKFLLPPIRKIRSAIIAQGFRHSSALI